MTFPRQRGLAVLSLALALAACERGLGSAPGAAHAAGSPPAERGYVPPPAATSATTLSQASVALSGTAEPGGRVRLATPEGRAIFALADKTGRWRMILPPADGVRLFGLSEPGDGRPVQAQGYLGVTPRGEVIQLRAGSGAVELGDGRRGVSLLAVDFDRKGGAVLSGVAAPSSPVRLTVDDRPRGAARAGPDGRFMLALNEPLAPGAHRIEVAGAAHPATLTISPAASLRSGPFAAAPVEGGWRIDWLTPGGGVQSTVIFEPAAS